ncbi:hypothetical protein B566_EDAN005137 [Ephemera danica]|nr:hypothetical protein B566_EDAN005137 [Ephemera danica]
MVQIRQRKGAITYIEEFYDNELVFTNTVKLAPRRRRLSITDFAPLGQPHHQLGHPEVMHRVEEANPVVMEELVVEAEIHAEPNLVEQVEEVETHTQPNPVEQVAEVEIRAEPNLMEQVAEEEIHAEPNLEEQVAEEEIHAEPNLEEQVAEAEIHAEPNLEEQVAEAEMHAGASCGGGDTC